MMTHKEIDLSSLRSISKDELQADPEAAIKLAAEDDGPLIIQDSDGPDMVLFSWEQYWERYGSLHEKGEKARIEKLCRECAE